MSQRTEAWGEGKETVISVEEWEAEPDNDGTCCICLESPTKNPQQVKPCKHVFCSDCLAELRRRTVGQLKCPLCRTILTEWSSPNSRKLVTKTHGASRRRTLAIAYFVSNVIYLFALLAFFPFVIPVVFKCQYFQVTKQDPTWKKWFKRAGIFAMISSTFALFIVMYVYVYSAYNGLPYFCMIVYAGLFNFVHAQCEKKLKS